MWQILLVALALHVPRSSDAARLPSEGDLHHIVERAFKTPPNFPDAYEVCSCFAVQRFHAAIAT